MVPDNGERGHRKKKLLELRNYCLLSFTTVPPHVYISVVA